MNKVARRTEKPANRTSGCTDYRQRTGLGHFARGFLGPLLLCTLAQALPAYAATPSPEQIVAEARAQRIFETRFYLADLARLERIAYSVLQAASPYCVQNRKYSLGVPPTALTDLPQDLRAGAIEAFGTEFSTRPRFLHIPRDTPHAAFGVKEGDQLLSLIDDATGKTVSSGWVFNRPPNTYIQNQVFKVELSRDGEKRLIEIRPQLICDTRPQLLRRDDLVARVSGGMMTVSTGMLRFVRSDDELALLLSNELAHNLLQHVAQTPPKYQSPGKSGAQYSPEEERAADYLGAYIAVLAGFDADNANAIWARVASNLPSKLGDGVARLHPYGAERAIWQRTTLAEIRYKKLNGQQLVPDDKTLPADFRFKAVHTDDTNSAPEDARLYDIGEVPFVSSVGRSGYQRFLSTPLRPRAFAVAPNGNWAYKTGANASAEALKNCATPASSCYLYAIDDRVVWNPETAERLPQPSIADQVDPRLSQVSEVPYIDDDGRAGYERFLNMSARPRAFAIGPNGNGIAAWTYRSGPNASSDALAQCLLRTKGRPCYLYAVDDKVVWSLDSAPVLSRVPRETAVGSGALRRPPASGFAEINDLAAIPLSQEQLATYRAFLEKPAPRAFVISRDGFGRYWLGTAAMEDALAYCERLGDSCWLYAVDNDVVWQADKTKRISRREQLPRQSEETQFLK